jgi:DHA1 family multidrug resistance protein-like MFS transporter
MKDNKRAYRFFAACTLLSLAANFAHPVTPALIQQRGFGDYMFGVALAAMMVMNFLTSPFWGRMVNYISSRRVALICCTGYAVGQAMFGLATSEGMMIGARMFAGMFTGGAFTSLLTYLVNTSPEESRSRYLLILATLQTVAGAFGYFVGGMLGEISLSLAIIAQAIALGACGVIFYFMWDEDSTTTLKDVKPIKLFKEANPLSAFLAGRSMMTPIFVTLFVVCALASLGSVAFDQSFNYYLRAQLGLSSGYNGVIKAIIGFVCLAANLTVGAWIMKKTDLRRSSIYVYLLCSSAMLAVIFTSAVIPFIAANVLYFGFLAISVPLTQSLVADRARGKDSNLVMGYYGGLRSLGGIFGSLSAGFLYTIGPKLPFVLGFSAFVLATLASVYYYVLSRRDETAAAQLSA